MTVATTEGPTLDRRVNAYRDDLADSRLAGRVASAHFVAGEPFRIGIPSTPIRRAPRSDASIDSEALFGELVRVFEETIEGWAWVQLATDGYVGYVASDALSPVGPEPTHRVTALRTFLYPAPDMKLPPLGALSLGAALSIAGEAETRGLRYGLLAGGGAIVLRHVAPLAEPPEPDYVAVAERFVGVPYLWGGRTSLGLDCSALVQLSLAAAGIAAPRDSDQQAIAIGEPLAADAVDRLEPGDIVAWRGHIGIICGPDTVLHASGFHMQVVSEPFRAALARIGASAGPPTALRRLPQYSR